MKSGQRYNLLNFRTGKYEIKNGRAGEIKEFLNMPDLCVSNACEKMRVFCGMYTLELSESIDPIVKPKKEIPNHLYIEWEEITQLFKRVEWIKKGDAASCNAKILV